MEPNLMNNTPNSPIFYCTATHIDVVDKHDVLIKKTSYINTDLLYRVVV